MASLVVSFVFFLSFHLYIIHANNVKSNDKSSHSIKLLSQLNGIQKGNHHRVNEYSDSFHLTSHYSFFDSRSKWSKRKLKYGFSKNVKKNVALALSRAFKQWASATPFRFTRACFYNKADIKISFVSGDHGDGYPFGVNPYTLAHAFPPPDGRVHFDVAQNWSTNGAKDKYDVQTVGLHELGHALGLGDSDVEEAIMFPTIYPGERKGLHQDDIQGIKALYKF